VLMPVNHCSMALSQGQSCLVTGNLSKTFQIRLVCYRKG
jgi:hypothetical protein